MAVASLIFLAAIIPQLALCQDEQLLYSNDDYGGIKCPGLFQHLGTMHEVIAISTYGSMGYELVNISLNSDELFAMQDLGKSYYVYCSNGYTFFTSCNDISYDDDQQTSSSSLSTNTGFWTPADNCSFDYFDLYAAMSNAKCASLLSHLGDTINNVVYISSYDENGATMNVSLDSVELTELSSFGTSYTINCQNGRSFLTLCSAYYLTDSATAYWTSAQSCSYENVDYYAAISQAKCPSLLEQLGSVDDVLSISKYDGYGNTVNITSLEELSNDYGASYAVYCKNGRNIYLWCSGYVDGDKATGYWSPADNCSHEYIDYYTTLFNAKCPALFTQIDSGDVLSISRYDGGSESFLSNSSTYLDDDSPAEELYGTTYFVKCKNGHAFSIYCSGVFDGTTAVGYWTPADNCSYEYFDPFKAFLEAKCPPLKNHMSFEGLKFAAVQGSSEGELMRDVTFDSPEFEMKQTMGNVFMFQCDNDRLFMQQCVPSYGGDYSTVAWQPPGLSCSSAPSQEAFILFSNPYAANTTNEKNCPPLRQQVSFEGVTNVMTLTDDGREVRNLSLSAPEIITEEQPLGKQFVLFCDKELKTYFPQQCFREYGSDEVKWHPSNASCLTAVLWSPLPFPVGSGPIWSNYMASPSTPPTTGVSYINWSTFQDDEPASMWPLNLDNHGITNETKQATSATANPLVAISSTLAGSSTPKPQSTTEASISQPSPKFIYNAAGRLKAKGVKISLMHYSSTPLPKSTSTRAPGRRRRAEPATSPQDLFVTAENWQSAVATDKEVYQAIKTTFINQLSSAYYQAGLNPSNLDVNSLQPYINEIVANYTATIKSDSELNQTVISKQVSNAIAQLQKGGAFGQDPISLDISDFLLVSKPSLGNGDNHNAAGAIISLQIKELLKMILIVSLVALISCF